jgi:hypothetical protein
MAVKSVSFYGAAPQAAQQQIDPRSRMAQMLMDAGSRTTPVQSVGEGITRALSGVAGGYFAGEARRDAKAKEEAGMAEAMSMLKNFYNTTPDQGMVRTDMGNQVAPEALDDSGEGGSPNLSGAEMAAAQAMPQAIGGMGAIGTPTTAPGQRMAMALLQQDAQQKQAIAAEQRALADKKTLKQTPGGPNSPTGRPGADIQNYDKWRELANTFGENDPRTLAFKSWADKAQQTIGLGNRIVILDPTNPTVPKAEYNVGTKPADRPDVVSKKAAAGIEGKEAGDAAARLAAADAAMPQLEAAVIKLAKIGEAATYTTGGASS